MSFTLMYDECFLDHYASVSHPECPERLHAIRQRLMDEDIFSISTLLPSRPATIEELTRAHTKEMVSEVLGTLSTGTGHLDPDTFFSPGSAVAARHAAGGTIDAVRAVFEQRTDFAFALIRPPGHHATSEKSMGFCIFNNVAVAAHALLAEGAKRILIFDWDVHHGNGTQHIFYDDPRVLFISVHQWPQYPGTGRSSETGKGEGKGFTLNLPFPARSTDADYAAVMERVVCRAAESFQPEMVLVSAGFDAHAADPLGGMRVTTAGFAYMAKRIKDISRATGRGPCFVLEGGYNLNATADSVTAVIRATLGESIKPITGTLTTACDEIIDTTSAAIKSI